MAQYVVIGNGVAATGCIEGIRSVDKDSSVAVISEEKHPVYCRPLISYYLEGKTDLEKMNYRADDFYEKNGCSVFYGRKAERIDTKNKTVVLDDGTVVPYTSVCAAAGSSPFVPAYPGLESVKSRFTFQTLDDALGLEQVLNEKSRVLILGAGLIGLKCAEGICGRVKQVVVCNRSEQILSRILDREAAQMMQQRMEEHGIAFLLGETVSEFEEATAVLNSGRRVGFDVLVLALGVRPNLSLVKDAGGEVHSGILVDSRMQTSLKGVYAAGDCTEGDDISLGQKRVLAILPNAYMQGWCAGVNMAGGTEEFRKAIPMNSVGFFGLHAMTAGRCFGENEGGEIYEEKTEGSIKRLCCRDGRLTGFMLVGDTQRAGIYTALIREKTPLDSLDFDRLKKLPALAAFSEETRRNTLGGVV